MGSNFFGSYATTTNFNCLSDYWDCHSHLCCFTNKLSLQSLTWGTRKLSKIGTYSFVFPLLVAGLAIGYTAEYYTSNAYSMELSVRCGRLFPDWRCNKFNLSLGPGI
ncbi:hypothetical protein POM88_026005 [Heracleum sosnowskyi]|uniref:Uncharacterized protein n=1 Tax=Heracleum sosnowskyi TaxID=360622 RepID=A0AAD8MN37_9APIA|nr:hypothetical protein POM88_026005 [Heracleum sosnowskyi]